MKQPRGKRVSIDRGNGWLYALQPLDQTRLRTSKLQCKSEQPRWDRPDLGCEPQQAWASLAIFNWTRQVLLLLVVMLVCTVRVKVAPEVALSTLPACIPATIGHGRKFVGGHAARRCR
jgi:hypothetical protein